MEVPVAAICMLDLWEMVVFIDIFTGGLSNGASINIVVCLVGEEV